MDYKKILEGVVNIINITEKSDIGFANICTYIGEKCPELKESEDEKIRKALICGMYALKEQHKTCFASIPIDNAIAWLEKQGEFYTKRDVDNAYIEGMAFAKDELEKQNKQILANSAKTCKDEQQPTDNNMKEALRTEYEKGRADAIAEMQNLAWSEEDDLILETIIDHIIPDKPFIANGFTDEELVTWLKSLKNRVQPRRRHTIFDEII